MPTGTNKRNSVMRTKHYNIARTPFEHQCLVIQIESGVIHYSIVTNGDEDGAEVYNLSRPASKKVMADLDYLHYINGGGTPRAAGRFLNTLKRFVKGQGQ